MKIAAGLVSWTVLCGAAIFAPAGGDTNSPSALVPAHPSVAMTNQAPKALPTDDSIDSLRKRAESGDAKSQVKLGNLYWDGKSFPENYGLAVQWYRKAADQGDAEGLSMLAVAYGLGAGVPRDEKKAETLEQDSFRQYQAEASDGDAEAQWELGDMLEFGGMFWSPVKNSVEAAKWYERAAKQGNLRSEWTIARCYETGVGVDEQPVLAAEWYQKAADQGDERSQCKVGVYYLRGIGVAKDPVEAAKYLGMAARKGDSVSQGMLGDLYIRGLGVIKNEVEGLAWLYVSNANGNETASSQVSSAEGIYSAAIVEAARERATEIQGQIASQKASVNNDSTAAAAQASPNAPRANGSGAFISADGLILTAAHVVKGAARIEVATAAGRLAATVVKIDPTNDIAVLKCTGSNFTPLPIAPSKSVRAGTPVFTLGFPNIQIQGLDPKLTRGEISSEAGYQDDPRQWQISVPIQPGNSGGPLCDENGNLIGIVESTLDPLTMAKVEGEIPQNVNYAVKSSYILPLLDDVQDLPALIAAPAGTKFEDTVSNVQKSVVLILIY